MSHRVGAKTKGWIVNNVSGAKKNFQFNPTEFEFNRQVTYDDITAPGIPYPNTQFIKGEARNFSVPLFFYDNPYSAVIDDWIEFLGKFLTPEYMVKGYIKPPSMTFCYANFIKKCVLTDLNIKITRFDENKNPIQAEITLNLRQVGV